MSEPVAPFRSVSNTTIAKPGCPIWGRFAIVAFSEMNPSAVESTVTAPMSAAAALSPPGSLKLAGAARAAAGNPSTSAAAATSRIFVFIALSSLFVPPEGPAITFDATYLDIVPGRRIIYSYDMRIGAERISVSLAAIEFEPTMGGTQLTVTEHGVYLDGLDDVTQRRRGTEELIDAMVRSLDASDEPAGPAS